MAFLKANPNNSGLRGRMAGQVYAGGGEDTIVKQFTKPTATQTPAKSAAEARFTRGAQGWGLLTDAQRAAWTAAARGVLSKDPRRLRPKAISGPNLYTALTAKFLQLSPAGTVPAFPPAGRFPGDGVTFEVDDTGGSCTITASAANRPGVTCEFLTQALAAAYRKPTGEWRHAAFHAFAAGTLSYTLALPAGYTALAVQFVETATGRVTGFQTLGSGLTLRAVEGGLAEEAERPARAKKAA